MRPWVVYPGLFTLEKHVLHDSIKTAVHPVTG